MKPVIACIRDGLGNQLFQFASGFSLAARLGLPLVLDISAYSSGHASQPRALKLLQLVDEDSYDTVITNYTIVQKARDQLEGLLLGNGRHSRRYGLPILYSQSGDDRPVDDLKSPYYLAGYQFDYRDFVGVSQYLRKMILKNLEKIPIRGDYCHSYAFVHVRRGDYISSKRFKILDKDYFYNAMMLLEENLGSCEWIVCSDDIDTAMSLMHKDFSCRPSREIGDLQDLRLMVGAKGGVISNSTFSFWGAFLGDTPSRVIVAPSQWRVDGRPKISIPDHWVLLRPEVSGSRQLTGY